MQGKQRVPKASTLWRRIEFRNICLKYMNVAALVIFLMYAPLFNVRNLQKNPDEVVSESNFMQMEKPPVSMHLDMISGSLKCTPTSKLKFFSKRSGVWILQSYTSEGTKKVRGGDEYYVTYQDNNNTSKSPSAVAHIKDNKDGTYALHFVKSRLDMVRNLPMVGKGTVTVFLANTCGIGLLGPPLKNNWTLDMKNGVANSVYKLFNQPMPVMGQPSTPKSYGFELSQYDHVYAIGDSLMAMFRLKRPNTEYIGRGGTALNSHTLGTFKNVIAQSVQGKYGKNNKIAFILGSCAWDILGFETNFDEFPRFSFEINDHLEAMKLLLTFTKTKFPKADVYWKSCTSVHQHVNHCSMQLEGCSGHLLYVSSRRTKKLDVAQKAIAKEFNVSVLDMFDMSFEMAEFNYDSRHFDWNWSGFAMDHFYPYIRKV